VTLIGTVAVSPWAGAYWEVLRGYWDNFVFWVQGLFS
jgi:hypothetical protein